jgi:hypothetical protein
VAEMLGKAIVRLALVMTDGAAGKDAKVHAMAAMIRTIPSILVSQTTGS